MKKTYLSIWIMFAVLCVLTGAVAAAVYAASARLPDNVGRMLSEAERAEVIGRNSPLIDYVYLSPMADFPRKDSIQKITIHHMSDTIGLERLGEIFSEGDRKFSTNYAIDTEGKVALYVEESNRAWSFGSKENDHQAVTIEVANDENGREWHVSDASLNALVDLCADICRRNGIRQLSFTGDAEGNLTLHSMFAETECPGPYLESRMPEIVAEVNRRLE